MNDKIEEMSETDFRFYLDNILKGINSQFNLFTKQQDRIEKKVDDICKTIETMQNQIAKQYDNCQNTIDMKDLKERVPTKEEIDKAEKENEILKKNVGELVTIKKYWKVFVIALVAIAAVGVITWTETFQSIRKSINSNTEFRKEQDSINTVIENKEIKSILKKPTK